jgi:outer membrane protein assembly factor BamB
MMLFNLMGLLLLPAITNAQNIPTDSPSIRPTLPQYEIVAKVNTGGAVYAKPILTPTGKIIIGSHSKSIFFLNPDGTVASKTKTKGWIHATAGIVEDQAIVGSYDGKLYFFNADGKLLFTSKPGGRAFSQPLLLDSGQILIGSNKGGLLFLDETGNRIHNVDLGGMVHSSPKLLRSGNVAVGSNGNRIVILSPSGEILNTRFTEKMVPHSSAVQTQDGRVVLGSYDGKLYFVKDPGEAAVHDLNSIAPVTLESQQYEYQTDGRIHANPLILNNGNIVVGSFDQNIHFVSPKGLGIKKIKTNGKVVSSAAQMQDGTVVVGSYDRNLYFLTEAGDIIETLPLGGKIFSSPLVLADQTIVIGCNDGYVYFIKKK